MKVPISKCPFDLERLQREVNILLISDLHYDLRKERSKPLELRGKRINKELVLSIEGAGDDWEPDIVIVAGDLVNQNESSHYKNYFDLLGKLIRRFPNLKHCVFSTPGNHDVNRKQFLNVLPYLHSLYGNEVKNSYTGNQIVDMLFSVSKKELTPDLQELLSNFENDYFSTYLQKRRELEEGRRHLLYPQDIQFPVEDIKTVYFTEILGLTLVCHNSSFFCNLSQMNSDRNNLFLIRALVEKMNSTIPKSAPIITFMHHPFYFLHDTEHVAPTTANPAKGEFNNFIKIVDNTDIIAAGHVHGVLHDPTFLQNKAYMITNGTSFTTEDFDGKCYPYTYALIKINKQLRKFAMKKFCFQVKDGSKYTKNGYYCDAKEESNYYDFFERSDAGFTSVEMEKLRTLLHISNVKARQTHLTYKLFVYQLGLYQDEFRFNKLKKFDITSKRLNASHVREVLIKAPAGKAACIYLIESEDYMEKLETILKDFSRTTPKNTVVYFSVKHSLLLEKGKVSLLKIETLHQYFKSLVLLSKKEKISINLLYH